jgi:hypothetical protein
MGLRSLRAGLLVPLLALAVAWPAVPASAAHHIAGLELSQRTVDFGLVPVDAPGCAQVNGELVGCVVQTVTLTNTGSDVLLFDSFSTCDKVFRSFGSCSDTGPSWGGMFSDNGNPSSCIGDLFDYALDPGESCQLTLLAVPSAAGRITGYVVARVHAGPGPLDLDYTTIRVSVTGA